jgi:hypothetical protein
MTPDSPDGAMPFDWIAQRAVDAAQELVAKVRRGLRQFGDDLDEDYENALDNLGDQLETNMQALQNAINADGPIADLLAVVTDQTAELAAEAAALFAMMGGG